MFFRTAFLATTIAAVCATPATAADNWAYSELNKTIPGGNSNTPEDDARPGEYYFMRGVEAFRAQDYGHAIKMYQVAASWGYKNAQYNLGVMYARGQGVEVDLPRAMAWMALAAERNDKQYVDGREVIYSLLSNEQWIQANVIWRDLKQTYADAVALPRAKARWAEVRNGMTGSHVGSIGHLEVGAPLPHSGVALVSALADPIPGQPSTVPRMGYTAADVAGANAVDGAIAYRELRSTTNPYDPKLSRIAIGSATVESPQQVDRGRNNEKNAGDATKPSEPQPAEH